MNYCPNCHSKILRWYLFKRSLIKKEYPVKCPECSQPLYFTAKSLKMTLALITILPIMLIMFVVFNVQEEITGLIMLVTLLIMLTGYPFLLELTDKEEKLF